MMALSRYVVYALLAVVVLTGIANAQEKPANTDLKGVVVTAGQEKPRYVYLRDSIVAVLRGPVRDVSVNDRYNMIQECIRAALSDPKARAKDAKIVVAQKTETKQFGSYKFEIRKGDGLLMVAEHIIHIITPEDAAMGKTSVDAQAKYLLANLKKEFDKARPTGNEVMINKAPPSK
jgi:hypothetical protein